MIMNLVAAFLVGIFVCDLGHVLWKKYKTPKQTTWCYCPGCKKDLCTSEVFYTDTDLVRYYCLTCFIVSLWDFDAPVPMLISSYYLDPNDWKKS